MAVPRRYLAARLANLLPRRNKIAGTVLRLSGRPCTHKIRAGANRHDKGDADRLPNRPRRAIASRHVRAHLSRPLRSRAAGDDPARQPAAGARRGGAGRAGRVDRGDPPPFLPQRRAPAAAPALRGVLCARILPVRCVPAVRAAIRRASLRPVRGAAWPVAQGVATAAIILLFFLNGVRLPRDEVLHGIRNWKLQAGNLAFCFVAMALLGVAAQAATAPFLPATLALGFLFLGILPSTVPSATAASSRAGGNEIGRASGGERV